MPGTHTAFCGGTANLASNGRAAPKIVWNEGLAADSGSEGQTMLGGALSANRGRLQTRGMGAPRRGAGFGIVPRIPHRLVSPFAQCPTGLPRRAPRNQLSRLRRRPPLAQSAWSRSSPLPLNDHADFATLGRPTSQKAGDEGYITGARRFRKRHSKQLSWFFRGSRAWFRPLRRPGGICRSPLDVERLPGPY